MKKAGSVLLALVVFSAAVWLWRQRMAEAEALLCAGVVQKAQQQRVVAQFEAAAKTLEEVPVCKAHRTWQREKAELTLALAQVPQAEQLFAALASSDLVSAPELTQWGYTLAVQQKNAEAERAFLRALQLPDCEPRTVTYLTEVAVRLGHESQLEDMQATAQGACRALVTSAGDAGL